MFLVVPDLKSQGKFVKGILTNKEMLKRLAQSPSAMKTFGKKGSPVKGIKDIKVDSLNFTQISLSLLPGTGINMSVINKIDISGKSFLGGRTEMKMEVNIVTVTSLKTNESNCPQFTRDECQTNLIEVKANIPKGVLPSVMKNFLDKNLKTLLPRTLCPAVDCVLLSVNEKLCLKHIDFPFGKSGNLLYSVSSLLPAVTKEHMIIELNIKVLHGEDIISPPTTTSNVADLPSFSGVTSLALTADFLGCSMMVLQQEGAFNLQASEMKLTEAGVMSLSKLGEIIPELSPAFQNYKLDITVDQTPMVTLEPAKAILHLYSTMEMRADLQDILEQSLFVVNLHMNFRLQFSIDKTSLHCKLSLDRIFLSLNSSSVGQFEAQDLDEFILSVIHELYTHSVNGVLQAGVPLPDMVKLLDIDFTKGRIKAIKDLLVFSVNVCKY
uniref:Lipid-binding serum glycoprotein C-terminal domain-containing protein n=1 Tax=Xenopus tropicalis TaxID=8364 RepID=A0A803K2H0_XENTR